MESGNFVEWIYPGEMLKKIWIWPTAKNYWISIGLAKFLLTWGLLNNSTQNWKFVWDWNDSSVIWSSISGCVIFYSLFLIAPDRMVKVQRSGATVHLERYNVMFLSCFCHVKSFLQTTHAKFVSDFIEMWTWFLMSRNVIHCDGTLGTKFWSSKKKSSKFRHKFSNNNNSKQQQKNPERERQAPHRTRK